MYVRLIIYWYVSCIIVLTYYLLLFKERKNERIVQELAHLSDVLRLILREPSDAHRLEQRHGGEHDGSRDHLAQNSVLESRVQTPRA